MKLTIQRLFLTVVVAIACCCSMAQFNGVVWGTNVNTAPNALFATGWSSGTGNFPPGVPWQWTGTFSWTVTGAVGVTPPEPPLRSTTTGTTTIDFANMATGVLPSGSWMYFGDIDENTSEWIDVQALDVNGSPITSAWLKLPYHFWPDPNASRPNAAWNSATGRYRFTGYDSLNRLNTLAFQTSANIRTLRIVKNHVNNGFGLGAPKESPFQGIEELVKGCCEPKNFIENSTFKGGNVGFGSNFAVNNTANPLALGQYGIFNGASVISRLTPPALPLVVDEVTGLMSSGSFLVGRVTNTPTVIWKQVVNIPQGELAACVRLKPFYNNPASPPVIVSFRFTDNNSSHSHTQSWWPLPLPGAGGWHDFTGSFHRWGTSPVTMEIIAHSPAANARQPIYLALDNVALKPKTLVPNPNLFALTPSVTNLNLTAGTYNVVLTNWPNPNPLGYFLSITDLSNNQEVQNPAHWWYGVPPAAGFNFPGYLGSGTNNVLSGPIAGVFFTNRNYRITYGLWGTCEKWTTASWEIGYFGPGKKDGPPQIRKLQGDANSKPPKGFNPAAIFEKLRPNKAPEVKPGRRIGGSD